MEPWQREDAKRLRDLWDAKRPMSQERFAAEFFNATQGAVFQYIDGRIPLNLDALIRFATGLSVKVDDISPTLSERLRAVVGPKDDPLLPLTAEERLLIERYRSPDPRWQLLRVIASSAAADETEAPGKIFPKMRITAAAGAQTHTTQRRGARREKR